MDRIYVIIAGSDAKTVATIRNFLLTLDLASEYCDIERLPCHTAEDLLRVVIEKTQHSKVIAIMLEDLTPRFENSGFESIIVQQSFQKKALHHLLDIPEFQKTVSSILILSYPGLDADEEMHLVDKVGNFSVVSGSFESIRNDAGWRHLKSAFTKAVRRFTEALQDSSSSSFEGEMLVQSKEMRKVISLIDRFAQVDSTVLIQGETGTGKELVAKLIHAKSKRVQKPTKTVNCGALPDGVIESELFGHVKGAFTGAIEDRKGLFEAADGGTIFLDEIGELPIHQQVKLLRVLQERTIVRVGSSKEIPVNVRIIAATNRDLGRLVETKEFREDLFYRINVCQINIPPLRQRPQEILPLVKYFLKKHNATVDRPKTFTIEALRDFKKYSWSGNVRELENVVEAAFIRSIPNRITSTLVRTILHNFSLQPDHHIDTLITLDEMEAKHIQFVLDSCGGVKAKALRILKIDAKTLDLKIRKYDLIVHS